MAADSTLFDAVDSAAQQLALVVSSLQSTGDAALQALGTGGARLHQHAAGPAAGLRAVGKGGRAGTQQGGWTINERPTATEACKRAEAFTLAGALDDPRPDKSAWIRIWAVARRAMGRSADAQAWTAAYAAGRDEEQERTRWLLRNSGPPTAQTDLDDLLGPGREP